MSRRRTFLLPKRISYQLPKSCLQNWWILKSNFNFSKHNVSLKALRLLWGFFTPCIMKDEWIRILQNPYLRLSRTFMQWFTGLWNSSYSDMFVIPNDLVNLSFSHFLWCHAEADLWMFSVLQVWRHTKYSS